MKIFKIIPLSLLAILLLSSFNFRDNLETEILGTWVAEGNNYSHRWVITRSQITKYTNNEVYKVYSYSITHTNCNGEVDNSANYLTLVNIDNQGDKQCLLLHGITENTTPGEEGIFMSIEYPNNPRPVLFKKQ